jgi:amino acid permease
MIGIPFALSLSGMITGIVLLIVMGFFTDYSIRLLVRLSEVTGCKSYPALCTYYGGLKAYVTTVLGCVLATRENGAANIFRTAT